MLPFLSGKTTTGQSDSPYVTLDVEGEWKMCQ